MTGVVPWFGGKSYMLKRLLPLIPNGSIYCEPYGGAGSVMINRAPAPCDVYNDIDGRLVNLFRVMQSAKLRRRLFQRLRYTPYSLSDFCLALDAQKSTDPVESAWGFFVAQCQGFSGNARRPGDWSRSFESYSGMNKKASSFAGRKKYLEIVAQRFLRVIIDNRCALEFIKYWDTPETVFYVDPPYVLSTRSSGKYVFDCNDSHHASLVDLLLRLQGMVVLSGYDTDLYQPLLDNRWVCRKFNAIASSLALTRSIKKSGEEVKHDRARTECVWLNPAAEKASGVGQFDFLGGDR